MTAMATPIEVPDKATFTLNEVAELMRVHVDTIRRWINEQKIPNHMIIWTQGGHRKLSRAGVQYLVSYKH